MVRIGSLVLLSMAMVSMAWAQKNKDAVNFSEGYVRYQLELDGVSDELSTVIDGSTLSIYFKNDWAKTELAILAGVAKMQLISNPNADNPSTLLMDIPTVAEKTAVDLEAGQSSLFMLLQPQSHDNGTARKPQVRVFKHQTHRIARHRCHRVELLTQDGTPIVFYVTPKIRTAAPAQFPWQAELGGFPLAIEMELEGATLRLFAESVERQPLLHSLFEVPNDYSHQDMSEFKDDMFEKLGIGNGSTRYGL